MNSEAQLHHLLRTWHVTITPVPAFRHAVWSRIRQAQDRGAVRRWSAVRDWLVSTLPRPACATALVMIFVLAGIGVADIAATRAARAEESAMKERYLTSIDPLAIADASLHPR